MTAPSAAHVIGDFSWTEIINKIARIDFSVCEFNSSSAVALAINKIACIDVSIRECISSFAMGESIKQFTLMSASGPPITSAYAMLLARMKKNSPKSLRGVKQSPALLVLALVSREE